MASLDEFIAQAQGNVSTVTETSTSIETTKGTADELASRFQAMSAEAMASGAGQLKQLTEQAQALLEPVKAKLEEAITAAQAMKS